MKIGILGSGFGLYGYLPALAAGLSARVLLPELYRERLAARADIGHLAAGVLWEPDLAGMLDAADAVVVAHRPAEQPHWVEACLERTSIRRLLLEKPLAPTPAEASDILDRVASRGVLLRNGCTFRYTGWAQALRRALSESGSAGPPVEIDWRFRAHHYAFGLANWKRSVSAGGGVLRFYGIHLLALLAELGYRTVTGSAIAADARDEAEAWRAHFSGPGLPVCFVRVRLERADGVIPRRCGGTLRPAERTVRGGYGSPRLRSSRQRADIVVP